MVVTDAWMMPADGAGMSPQLVTALFEVLYHPVLLHDEEIMLNLGRAMVHLSISIDIDFTEHRHRAAGLYSLLTHPDVAVRSLVRSLGLCCHPSCDSETLMWIMPSWHWQTASLLRAYSGVESHGQSCFGHVELLL